MDVQEGSKKFAELSGKLGGNIKKQVKQVGLTVMHSVTINVHTCRPE